MSWLHGLAGGALAAVVAALVSLPLNSPDDALMNTATVAIGALLVGLFEGALWTALAKRPAGTALYGAASLGAFLAVVFASFGFEALLSDSIEFVVPLAAIVFALAALVPPAAASIRPARSAQLGATGVALAAALAIGFGLAGVGDSGSGRLSLPDGSSGTPAGEVITSDDVAGVVYTVVPGESELTYTVREKLAILPTSSEAVGRTTALSGEITLDGGSQISVDLSTLASEQDRRDNYIRENIFQQSPLASFVLEEITELPTDYAPGTTVTRSLTGLVTVRGVERPLAFEVEARLSGDELQVLGRTDFTWADFEITPPNIPGIVQVEDNVHIEVLIIARVAAAPGA
jgi:polyisoprenoid-binding protein YceI